MKRIEAEAKLAAKRNAQNGSCRVANGTESHNDKITNGFVVVLYWVDCCFSALTVWLLSDELIIAWTKTT